MMIELNLRPRPVSVTTPTMMPAPAQVVATLSTPVEPASSALKNFDPKIPFTRGSRPRNRESSGRSEEHTSELQSPCNLVCRLLLEKKKKKKIVYRKQQEV